MQICADPIVRMAEGDSAAPGLGCWGSSIQGGALTGGGRRCCGDGAGGRDIPLGGAPQQALSPQASQVAATATPATHSTSALCMAQCGEYTMGTRCSDVNVLVLTLIRARSLLGKTIVQML